MADSFTQLSSVSSDTTAFEALAYFALRPQLQFDAIADVKGENITHRGSAVQFNIYDELSAQTSALSETADPDAIAVSDSTVTVTPVEQGAVVKTTAKLRASSFLDIDEDVANLVGFNAGLSLNRLARTQLSAGSNVTYGNDATSEATVEAEDTLKAADVRDVVRLLRGANVQPNAGGSLYWGFVHPDVAFDLMTETGDAGWLSPHVHSAPENIWSGELGSFGGVRFIETSEINIDTDGGSGNVDIYENIFGGKQALAIAHANTEGYGRFPTIVRGPMVDALQRIRPVGWKWLGAYKRFREASLRRVETASSKGSN